MLQQLAEKYNGNHQNEPIKKAYTPWETMVVDIEKALISVNGVKIRIVNSKYDGIKIKMPIQPLMVKFYLFPKDGLKKFFGRFKKDFLKSKYATNLPEAVLNEIKVIERIRNYILANQVYLRINDDYEQHELIIHQEYYEESVELYEGLIELGLFFLDRLDGYTLFKDMDVLD